MKKILIITALLLASLTAASAQNIYEPKQFVSSEGQSLNYRMLAPKKTDAKKKYPLVVFLHGAGERGNDNERQLIHGGQMFLNPANQEKYPAYVLFPQCPQESYWAFGKRPISFSKGPAGFDSIPREEQLPAITLAVKELIMEYLALPDVDDSRVYIMGLSMGGMGTYDMVSRYPELFAAAIPICGAAAKGSLAAAKDIKFRIYHGDADPIVPVECSRSAYRELKEAGADVEYFEFVGCDHGSWNPAFNQPDFLKWLFAQKNKQKKNR